MIVAINYFTKWAETKAVAAAYFLVQKNRRTTRLIEGTLLRSREVLMSAEAHLLTTLKTNDRAMVALPSPGLVERLNYTLSDILSMYVNSDHTDWDTFVPFITFAYNTSVQRSTGKILPRVLP